MCHSSRLDLFEIDTFVVIETGAPRFYRSIPIDIYFRKFTVDKDIRVVTPKKFETEKNNEYSFTSEIVRTGYVAYKA